MTAEDPHAPAPTGTDTAPTPPGTGGERVTKPGRRTFWSTIAIATGFFVCLVAAVTALVLEAPRYVARWVANNYLAGLDIDVDGVKTIDIDLPEGRFSFGPVQFRAAGAQPGAIGLLGLQVGLRNLLEQHALLERVVVQGVDIVIRQAPDGELSINGVSLRQILAEQAEQAEQPPPSETKSTSSWGAGIDHLELRDIAVTFINRDGGTARLAVEKLELSDFRTWEPEQPGNFDLVAGLNGIELRAKGQARPFAEKITAEADVEVVGIDSERVQAYTGPLGLDRAAGTVGLRGRSTFSLFPDGRLEGTSNTTISATDVDAAKEGAGNLRLGSADLVTDGRFRLAPGGEFGFDGTVGLKLEKAGAGTADGTGVTLDTASIGLEKVAVRRAETGELSVSAGARVEAANASVAGAAAATLAKLTLAIPRVEAALGADGTLKLEAEAAAVGGGPTAEPAEAPADPGEGKQVETTNSAVRLELAEPSVTAPIGFSAKQTSVDLSSLSVEMGAEGKLDLTTTATLAVDGGAVVLRDAEGAEGPQVAFASLTARAGDVALKTENGQTELSSAITAGTEGFRAELPAPPANSGQPAARAASGRARTRPAPAATSKSTLAADAIDLSVPSLKLQTSASGLAVGSKAVIKVSKPSAVLPGAGAETRVAADAIEVSVPAANVQTSATGMQLDGDGEVRVTKSTAALAGAGAPTEASVGDVKLRLSSLKVRSAGETTTASGSAALALETIAATAPQEGTSPWTVKLARARLGLDGLDASMAAPATKLGGKLDFAAENFEATQAAPAVAPRNAEVGGGATGGGAGSRTRLAFESLGLSLAPATFEQSGERMSLSASGGTQSTALAVELPRTAQSPAATAAVGSSRTQIEEISFAQAGEKPSWSSTIDILADKISAKAENGTLATIDLQSAAIADLEANDKERLSIERIALNKLQAFISRDYLTATSSKESRPQEAAEAVQTAAEGGWKIRVGSASIGNDSAIRFRDSSVEPPMNTTLDIRTLQVLNLNSIDPSQRTDFRLDAAIDQFTELGVNGWAAPFGKQPDFDVDARLRRLELPPLSPYAAKAVGVNVEGGRLSLDISAAAQQGNLKGLLDLTLRDLDFSALSPEDAQRLSATVGVPIETVVGLLQDDEGRIHLNLPISGDLANPSFDPSDAIRQALAGALQAAVLAPFQLAFAPVALLAKAASGSGGDKVGLQPVPFAPGQAKLDSAAHDQAMGLARVLGERDKLKLKVCGRATAQDLDAALREEGAPEAGPGRAAAAEKIAPELWSLAGERTANVRSAIISDGGAKPAQVGECRILYDPKDSGPPRVDVTF